jgi:ferrous-iron efflux pump FieF
MDVSAGPRLTLEETSGLTKRITRLSVGVSLALSAIKLAAFIASGSVAMLASLADSGLDVFAAATAYFAVRYAVAPPDREHRFGHGKAEAFASLIQAGLVFASAALIGREAVARILHPQAVGGQGWDMAVMAVSMVFTIGVVLAQTRVLKRATSVAVSGDRMHYITDLGSNVIAFAGIGLSGLIGSALPDTVAGLLVALVLLWGAVSVFRSSSLELMDHELDEDSRHRIAELMRQDPKVRDVHQLRTRASGPYIHVQMHADLEPTLSLVEAHQVIVAAERRVLDAFPTADIIIHADPRGQAESHGGAFSEAHETAN